MPNRAPVRMLEAPVKSRVAGNEMECERVRATRSGRRVPRSPRDPDSSLSGALRKVCKLCCVMRQKFAVEGIANTGLKRGCVC